MDYSINEMFDSIQGEGFHSGKLATFIRLQGCTVGCPWCDTKRSWKESEQNVLSDEIIASQIKWSHVVITGGEPTLHNLDPLIRRLRATDDHMYIQLETSGQNELKGSEWVDWVTWSPKRELDFKCAPALSIVVMEVKIVVDEALTEEEVYDIIMYTRGRAPLAPIMFMPEGLPPSAASYTKTYAFLNHFGEFNRNYRFCDRLQHHLGVL